ncbi:uncharacterized protein A4U43_C03F2180 [Asparagus officinalis]|uniref:Uncharacterized protein n=1 Tax=Asparagus officinalis TaxID=4686 RepID=A0A5P1FBN0_ASPOF|nr:uncharacterized protein A4U43_C03F2180 [Asparagus officinalis]
MDWQDNDWSYVAVAAFLVKHADSRKGDAYLLSRLNVCFAVVACRNATLIPWAFLLPYRLWVYFFTLVSHTSPILALQHLVIPSFVQDENTVRSGNSYIIIRGSSDGSITLDSTTTIDGFMQRTVEFRQEMLMYFQRRHKQENNEWDSFSVQPTDKSNHMQDCALGQESAHDLNFVAISGFLLNNNDIIRETGYAGEDTPKSMFSSGYLLFVDFVEERFEDSKDIVAKCYSYAAVLPLPFWLWIEIAALVTKTSPVVALQHLVILSFVQAKDIFLHDMWILWLVDY